MSRTLIFLGLLVLAVSTIVDSAPQFGGVSYSQANAQAGSFGGSQYPPRPGFGNGGGYGNGGFGPRSNGLQRLGFGNQERGPVSISISKSVSIGGGGRGGAGSQSSASAVSGK